MNIKTIGTLALLALTSAIVSCDNIDEDERFVQRTFTAERNVLVEEFTGQMCVNCPNGHQVLSAIQNLTQHHAIVVGIHAGNLALSESVAPGIGLANDEGAIYDSRYGVEAYPSAVINRKTAPISDTNAWQGLVAGFLETPATAELTPVATLSEDGKSINVSCAVLPQTAIDGKLQLWLTESGITNMQLVPTVGYDMNYVHNHVFRAAINGIDGQEVNLVADEMQSFSTDIAVKDDWNTDNLSVVAFIYNSKDGVIQVEETKVVKE